MDTDMGCGVGRPARRYWVNGKLVTIREVAEHYHTTENSIRCYLSRNKCSLQTAVTRLEARQRKRAEKAILRVVFGE